MIIIIIRSNSSSIRSEYQSTVYILKPLKRRRLYPTLCFPDIFVFQNQPQLS